MYRSVRSIVRFAILLFPAAGALNSVAQADARAASGQSQQTLSDVPRAVLIFYYPWYGNPNVQGGSGELSHWSGVNEEKRQIAASTNYPSLGPYDSHDPKLLAQHCRWAKEAGIDGFIVSWWGRGSFEDRAMHRLLDACQQAGLRATIYYETVPDPKNPESAARDVLDVLNQYAQHAAWLTVQSKPVTFVYGRAIDEIGLDGWKNAIAQMNLKYPRGAFFVGDRIDGEAARVFDGLHTYNPAGALRHKILEEVRSWCETTYPAWVKTAHDAGRLSAITVIPGYDDRKIRNPGFHVDRMDGALYRAQWEAAAAARPAWVLITSWNEWHEGSDIEPSKEYGEAYLQLTREFAGRFKRGE